MRQQFNEATVRRGRPQVGPLQLLAGFFCVTTQRGTTTVALLAPLLLACCGGQPQAWHDAFNMHRGQQEFSVDSGRCHMYANQQVPTVDSPSYSGLTDAGKGLVAAGSLLGAIANDASRNDAYRNCLNASGWISVSPQAQSQPKPQTVSAPPPPLKPTAAAQNQPPASQQPPPQFATLAPQKSSTQAPAPASLQSASAVVALAPEQSPAQFLTLAPQITATQRQASVSTAQQPAPAGTIIVVQTSDRLLFSSGHTQVFLDGRLVAELDTDHYARFSASAGRHRVSVSWKEHAGAFLGVGTEKATMLGPNEVDVVAEGRVYLSAAYRVNTTPAGYTFKQLTSAEGEAIIDGRSVATLNPEFAESKIQ